MLGLKTSWTVLLTPTVTVISIFSPYFLFSLCLWLLEHQEEKSETLLITPSMSVQGSEVEMI